MLKRTEGRIRTLHHTSRSNLLAGFSAKLIGFFNQIASTYLISGAVGASGLQKQMLAISFVSWFPLMLFGMQTSLPAVLLELNNKDKDKNLYIKSVYIIAIFDASVAVSIAIIVRALFRLEALNEAPVFTATVCAAALLIFGLSEQVFYATERFVLFSVLNVAGTALSLLATILFVYGNGSPSEFLIAFYLNMLLPVVTATCLLIAESKSRTLPSVQEILGCGRRLLAVGGYGFGFGVATYCKLQSPLLILDALKMPDEIARVGVALRFSTLIVSGASVVFPVLFVRIGNALQEKNQYSYRRLSNITAISMIAASLAIVAALMTFGDVIFRTWTANVVTLDLANRASIAFFSVMLLVQFAVMAITSPDPVVRIDLTGLYWGESVLILIVGTLGARCLGGAGLLSGMALVMAASLLIALTMLDRRRRAYRVGRPSAEK